MKARLAEYLKDRKILIMGYGKEGVSSYRLIRSLFPDISLGIADKRQELTTTLNFPANDNSVVYHLGEGYTSRLNDYDLILKSPGIPISEIPEEFHKKIESQAGLFIKCYRDQICGITGTKGKSTTSSLLWHLFKRLSSDSILVGNIGIPPFDTVDKIVPSSKIVYELSSHQLEKLNVSPKYAIILNIFQEHLDHYKNYESYQQAKMNITRYQKDDDYLIYCQDNQILKELSSSFHNNRRCYTYSQETEPVKGCYSFNEEIFWTDSEQMTERVMTISDAVALKGRHNVMNIMAVVIIAKIMGISNDHIAKSIISFKPLPHRLEYSGRFHDIDFYDDSISTIPEATIAAVNSLKEVGTLILGGKDRGIDYSELYKFVSCSKIGLIIFMGEAGNRMMKEYERMVPSGQEFILAKDFNDVVVQAINRTAAGKICLLSPAAASYDWFFNFEERGDIFQRLVSEI